MQHCIVTDIQGCFSTLCMLYVCVMPEQKKTLMLATFHALKCQIEIHSLTHGMLALWQSTREGKVRVTCLSRNPHWLCHWTRCSRGSMQGTSALHRHKGAICRRSFDALHQICRQNLVPTLHSTSTNLCQLHMQPMTRATCC